MSTREGFGEDTDLSTKETDNTAAVNADGTYNGPERRRTDFTSRTEKLFYDAAHLIRLSEEMSVKQGEYVHPHSLIRRKEDDVDNLKRAIYWKVFGDALFDGKSHGLKR